MRESSDVKAHRSEQNQWYPDAPPHVPNVKQCMRHALKNKASAYQQPFKGMAYTLRLN